MKTRMYIRGLLALAISSICTLLGEETSPGGIVHGAKTDQRNEGEAWYPEGENCFR